MNQVIYRAASHLNVRINEILRGESIERLTTEERAKVNDIQQVTEGLAGLQVDLRALERRIVDLETALKPFADIATAVDGFSIGDLYPLKCEDVNYHHSFGFARIVECRAARAALAGGRAEGGRGR